MVTKLQLYNKALGHLGPVRLTSLQENRPDRRELDAVYDGSLQVMLERGVWKFALRTVRLDPDTDVTPLFGLRYAYSKPTDWVRLRLISPDERQEDEDRTFREEGAYIFSDYSVLYVTFVSNLTTHGLNLGAYPELYANAVAAEMAEASGLPITRDRADKASLMVIKKRALVDARRACAVDDRVKDKPTSSWVRSRYGTDTTQRRSSTSTGVGNGE